MPRLAPTAGLEPATLSLTGSCATELRHAGILNLYIAKVRAVYGQRRVRFSRRGAITPSAQYQFLRVSYRLFVILNGTEEGIRTLVPDFSDIWFSGPAQSTTLPPRYSYAGSLISSTGDWYPKTCRSAPRVFISSLFRRTIYTRTCTLGTPRTGRWDSNPLTVSY